MGRVFAHGPGDWGSIAHRVIPSSSSCRAASMDIPDHLSPFLPIVHRLWQVFRALRAND